MAGGEEERVAGALTLEPEGPMLQLSGMLTPAWTEGAPNPEHGTTSISRSPATDNEYLTVHGYADGTPVTLIDSFTMHRRYSFMDPEVGEHQLGATYAVIGAHVPGNDALYTAVRFRTRHLDEWASLPGFKYRRTPQSIAYEQVDMPPVQLHNEGRLDLQQVVTMSSLSARGGALNRTVWLRATDLPPTRWRSLDRDLVIPLSSLLTLVTDTDCPVVEIEVLPQGEDSWCAVHSRGVRPPAERPFRPQDALIPRNLLGLPQFAAWLARVEVLGSLPSAIADTAMGPSQALETQVLILTTVAEGLARRLWPDWVRISTEEADQARKLVHTALGEQSSEVIAAVAGALSQLHEPSYPKRLLELAQHVSDVVPNAEGRRNSDGAPNRWKSAVVGARNELAHQLHQGWLDDTKVDRYFTVIGSLRWLLTAVLLRETGVDPDTLAECFNQHEPYKLFLDHAQELLPTVYGSTSNERTP